MTKPWTVEMQNYAIELLRCRSPGEWRVGIPQDSVVTPDVTYRVTETHRRYYGGECIAESMQPADRDFLIQAGPLLESAIAEIDRLRMDHDRLREANTLRSLRSALTPEEEKASARPPRSKP